MNQSVFMKSGMRFAWVLTGRCPEILDIPFIRKNNAPGERGQSTRAKVIIINLLLLLALFSAHQ